MAGLAAAFALQTALVYGDAREEPLSEAAVRGREIWHDSACQVCHQVYGNGGFLGPDLTNAASRVDDVRLTQVITMGSGQMPAFDISPEGVADLRAYLEALDRPDLGRGQLRMGDASTSLLPWDRFDVAFEAATTPRDGEVLAGYQAFSSRICSSCHLPFEHSSVTNAPDLSLTVDRISEEEIRSILVEGRPTLGMPPPVPALGEEEMQGMVAFLTWLSRSREILEPGMEAAAPETEIRWSDLPWWEYR